MDNKDRIMSWAIICIAAIAFFGMIPGTINLFEKGESFLGFANLISAALGVIGWLALRKKYVGDGK